MHELRESCYYNLCLWDMLVEHNNSKVPVLQEGSGLPPNLLDLLSSKELATKSEQQEHQQQEVLDNLRKGLKAYINGHALVNPVQFREALNHLKDILFERLRERRYDDDRERKDRRYKKAC